jgi:hypothetical protein
VYMDNDLFLAYMQVYVDQDPNLSSNW